MDEKPRYERCNKMETGVQVEHSKTLVESVEVCVVESVRLLSIIFKID